jgi:hypothetical protein
MLTVSLPEGSLVGVPLTLRVHRAAIGDSVVLMAHRRAQPS